jgi:transposase-like protein
MAASSGTRRGAAKASTPQVINTDKNLAYGEAIAELKKEGLLPKETQHRQVKYLNNHLDCDHGKLERLIKPTLGFQSMKTAYATIKGFEVMRMFTTWIDAICGGTEACFIHRLFGLYA